MARSISPLVSAALLLGAFALAPKAVAQQGSRFDRAQASAIRGRPAEVVALLEGHADDVRELTLLIEAYRLQQDVAGACRNIDILMQRFGRWPQAASYQGIRTSLCPARADPAPAPRAPRPDLMAEAQTAMRRGDLQAVVRTLEGRAHTPRELGLLIEAYRSMGNQRAACRNMELFARRYGSTPQAITYRQHIARQCNQ